MVSNGIVKYSETFKVQLRHLSMLYFETAAFSSCLHTISLMFLGGRHNNCILFVSDLLLNGMSSWAGDGPVTAAFHSEQSLFFDKEPVNGCMLILAVFIISNVASISLLNLFTA